MASLAPFEGVLGPRLAKHLLRRATFNISQERIDEFQLYTVDQALTALLTPSQKNLNQPKTHSKHTQKMYQNVNICFDASSIKNHTKKSKII